MARVATLRLTGILLATLVVVVAGAEAPASSVTFEPARAVRGVQSPQSNVAPTPVTDPSVVPQTISHSSEPGYNIVPDSQFHPTSPDSSSGQTVFRGGGHSRPPVLTGTAPAPPRSMLTPTSPRVAVYGALNKPGLTAASTQQNTPPDSTGAIGPNHYVEMANSSIAVYDRNNLNLVNSATLAAFINVAPGTFLCDPQIQWVPSANRWLYSFLYCRQAAGQQQFSYGWSKTPDPTTLNFNGWCQFTQSTGADLFDYMKLGHNSNYFIVGGNFYANPTTTPSFAGASIAWAPLPANGITSCTQPAFIGTTSALKNGDGVSYTFTPVPVNTYTNASDGYIVSAYDPLGNPAPGPRSKIAVWHLNSAGAFSADNDVDVGSYDVPSSAPQLGATSTQVLDTMDARLTQAVGDPVAGFYTQHTVAGAGRSEVHWYEFMRSGSAVALAQQGIVSSPTDWVFNAAISPRFDGQGAAIVYNRSSPTILPLIAARIRFQSTTPGTWAAGELVLASSSAPDSDRSCNSPPGAPCRWGDYAAASPDPVQTNLVWGTGEFNTASGMNPAWSNQNFAIWVAVAPSAVAAVADDGSAAVNWSAPPVESVGPVANYTIKAFVGASLVATMTTAGPVTAAIFKGLTNGTTYTFTVTANGTIGPSPESISSNAVTPTRAPVQSTSQPVSRDAAKQSDPVTSPLPR